MNNDELFIGGKYLFLDWFRQRIGELAPIVEVELVKIIPQHMANGFLHSINYEAVDKQGVMHNGSASSFRPLNWIDDREETT